MRNTITASVQKEGFEAILYPGNGRKDKVMIVMSGSNGGMTLTKQEAEFYHRNGIPSLALALFRTKQTPNDSSGLTSKQGEFFMSRVSCTGSRVSWTRGR